MHPVLATFGPFTLYSYGAMLVVAFGVTTWLTGDAVRRLSVPERKISPEQIMDFACVALLGGIAGGRALYVLLNWDVFQRTPADIPAIWHGGLIWYGGFLGGLGAGWLYTRANRLVFLSVLDLFMPFVALGHALGRVGCFLNGCCYGKPTDSWCGVVFPGHPTAVFPTQLMEAIGLILLYAVLRAFQRPAVLRRPGRLFGGYLVGYGVLRFLVEFLRGDQALWWANFTLPQVMSIGLCVAGFTLALRPSSPR